MSSICSTEFIPYPLAKTHFGHQQATSKAISNFQTIFNHPYLVNFDFFEGSLDADADSVLSYR
jgi:hypothetical protein